MKVIICGAGRVGFSIAERFVEEKVDVTIIDKSIDLVQKINNQTDLKGINGNAAYPHILKKAGAEVADIIIAVTSSDEVNMIICQVSHSLFKVPLKIARIRSQDYRHDTYADFFAENNMPVDVIISPERNCAAQIANRSLFPKAYNVINFVEKKIWVLAFKINDECPIVDTPLYQLQALFPQLKGTIVSIERNGKIFCPDKTESLLFNDVIYLVASKEDMKYAYKLVTGDTKKIKNTIIIGGGNIGFFTAQELTKLNFGTTLVEQDKQRAINISKSLHDVLVINGDGLNADILHEAGITSVQTLFALTDNQKVNLLVSILSKKLGCPNSLSIVNDPLYGILSQEIGINNYVNPKEATISQILQHVRQGRIKKLVSIQKSKGEIVDAIALKSSPLVGSRLRDCEIPKSIKIGAIVRKDEIIYPTGDTIINENDHVITYSTRKDIRKMEQMFKVSADFF